MSLTGAMAAVLTKAEEVLEDRRRDPRAWLAHLVEQLPGCTVIWGDDGTPYLLRIYVLHVARDFLPGVFIHYFYRGDHDRELHNHPWVRAWSLILTGGYREYRQSVDGGPVRVRTLTPGDTNHIGHDDFHRVDLLAHGCWTLFVAGHKEGGGEWGFRDHRSLSYRPATPRDGVYNGEST
jgi:hypothetical protein